MKLLTFVITENPTAPRLGALMADGETVADLQQGHSDRTGSASPQLNDMLSLLEGGEQALEQAHTALEFIASQAGSESRYAQNQVRLLAPVPRPRSIRDCISFEKHIVQATRTVVKWRFAPLAALDAWVEKRRGRALIGAPKVWYQQPLYYKSNPFSVVGPDAEVQWPRYTEKLDYELEFGIFIGRQGCNIPKERAHEHIAGYTIFNDFSARDVQLKEMEGRLGPAKGKDFDTGNVMGPYLVTADEIPEPYNLTMRARINGEEWSCGNSGEMYFTFADIIAHISQDETLYPGEFIGSGTVGGGCGLELDRWLQPNDVVELEVEGLGCCGIGW
ncbi:MAG: fumarylacetoacetate hydrolase family protein [Candidatus Competibacteraceae bacterium]|nr:fumarylacetoacetate hydrolase family protein [Candidatus Competibacteraceae bacterium]